MNKTYLSTHAPSNKTYICDDVLPGEYYEHDIKPLHLFQKEFTQDTSIQPVQQLLTLANKDVMIVTFTLMFPHGHAEFKNSPKIEKVRETRHEVSFKLAYDATIKIVAPFFNTMLPAPKMERTGLLMSKLQYEQYYQLITHDISAHQTITFSKKKRFSASAPEFNVNKTKVKVVRDDGEKDIFTHQLNTNAQQQSKELSQQLPGDVNVVIKAFVESISIGVCNYDEANILDADWLRYQPEQFTYDMALRQHRM